MEHRYTTITLLYEKRARDEINTWISANILFVFELHTFNTEQFNRIKWYRHTETFSNIFFRKEMRNVYVASDLHDLTQSEN